MKKLLIILFLPLFFSSCSKELVTNPALADNQNGKILLKIDKSDAPSSVVFVRAVLSRDGFNEIKDEVNLFSDSSSDISIDSIPAGTWHLTVEALDKDTVILYSGGTDVQVLAGVTIQVNLTLYPTGNGVGNILIHIHWGTASNWRDYMNNPIITPEIVPDNPLAVSHPKIIFEEGTYRMWFTSVYNSAVTNIWYATSDDGINWELGKNSPVLNYGDENTWDSHSVQSGVVLKDINDYKMYYLGFSDQFGQWNLGLATSSDGIRWIKYPTPVVYADSNEYQIAPGDIIKINNNYYLYYSVRKDAYYEIRLAISSDGVNFTKYQNNPILIADKYWESYGIYNPSIIYDDNEYKMIYMNSLGTGFGIAYSNDGKNWTKDSNNPFFELNETHDVWCQKIAYPFWRKINNKYKIFYVGNTGGYTQKIGIVQK